jgi:hypothetical protein
LKKRPSSFRKWYREWHKKWFFKNTTCRVILKSCSRTQMAGKPGNPNGSSPSLARSNET